MINIDLKRIEIIPLGTVSSGEGGSANADLTNYYTKGEVNTKLQSYSKTSHTHTEYITEDALNENYYNKEEVDTLIDNIDIPTGTTNVDLSDYYTKNEVDSLIPSEYIKGFNIGRNDDENFQVDDGVVNIYTQMYDGSYDISIDGTSVFGIKPLDNSIVLEIAGGTGNGNFRAGIKVNPEILSGATGGGNADLTNYYTKEELDTIMISNHISDIASWENKLIGLNIGGNMRNEIPFATINGKSIINTTDNIVISGEGGGYDDTALSNRVSALESELTGVSEQITELNNMVV